MIKTMTNLENIIEREGERFEEEVFERLFPGKSDILITDMDSRGLRQRCLDFLSASNWHVAALARKEALKEAVDRIEQREIKIPRRKNMTNLENIIESEHERFEEQFPPLPPFNNDVSEIVLAFKDLLPPEKYTDTEAITSEQEWCRRSSLRSKVVFFVAESNKRIAEAARKDVIDEIAGRIKEIKKERIGRFDQMNANWNKALDTILSFLKELHPHACENEIESNK